MRDTRPSDYLSRVHTEGVLPHPSIEFIDSRSSLYPYAPFGLEKGINPATLGYDALRKQSQIRKSGQLEAELLKLREKGEILEVGWGGNGFFAAGIYDATHTPISILDTDTFSDKPERFFLPENALTDGNLHMYRGSAIDLPTLPELVDKQFGSILFHGSLLGGGFTWTLKQSLETEHRKMQNTSDDLTSFVNSSIDATLQGVKTHLTRGGILFIGSDRFSLFSGGRQQEDMPLEKLEFLHIISRLLSLGVKKITIFGEESHIVETDLNGIIGLEYLHQLTNGVDALPAAVRSDSLTPTQIEQVKIATKDLIPQNIGIIDAIAVEFD